MKSKSENNLPTINKIEVSPKIIENLRKSGANKKCADCGDKNTSYVILNLGTFVCYRCALLHKELNHIIKDLNFSRFYESDQNLLTMFGNERAKKLWMEKFDPKKEKIPKSKDSQNFMKFLSDKYLDRKYASKDLEKELSFLNVERIGDKGENLSEPNSSSHDSSTPGKKITPGENMHSPQKNPDSLNEKSKLENMDLNLQNSDPFSSNEKNDIIYPNMTSNPLEKPSSPGVGLECEVFKENGQNDRNLFFFENFNIPCDNKVDINDWGFIWDNENKPNPIESEIKSVKDLDKPEAEYVENTESKHSNNDQEVFNLIKDERLDSNLTKSDPKEVKKADWEFPVEFDLVSRNTNTTTSSNTSPDNITNLSQNLCGIYSSAKAENKANTNNKKTFDDLERYLSDSAYITPAGKKPVAVPLSVNNTSITCAEGNLNYTNQFPNTQNTPSINPHMMMNYSYNINSGNNNYQMHPKSQTDYFTTNDREPINNNNTAYVVNNANYRSTTLGSASDNLDYHFNLLNLNTQRQNVHDSLNYNKPQSSSQSNAIKYDVFKDIYNYSKNNTKPSDNLNNQHSINGSNVNKNINANNPFEF